MRIAICEDNEEHLGILGRDGKPRAKEEGKPVAIGCYRSAEQFLFCMKDEPHYDLAFLDIQMSQINGLLLAKMIREEDGLIFLVFTTALKKYAPRENIQYTSFWQELEYNNSYRKGSRIAASES